MKKKTVVIVTGTYLYEAFFSGKFTDFVVYTLTGAQMYQQVERETRRKETTDKNTDIFKLINKRALVL